MMLPRLISAALLAALLLSACGAPRDQSGQVESRAGEGREETRGIRNTENIGYAGNAIADKVDSALDANEARTEELGRQLDAVESAR